MPPINLRMSNCDRERERHRETERDKGRGPYKGGIRESCLFCKADRKLSEMLSWDHVE